MPSLPLSSALQSPPKPLPVPSHRLQASSNPFLACGLTPRGSLVGRLRFSDQRSMAAELATADAFPGGDCTERGRAKEPKAAVGRGYRWGDVESVVNRMSKWLVSGLFGIVIVWNHDAEACWAATGSVVNSCLSFILKKMLNHQRPVFALRSDPGMPSSHAQSIFYAAFYAILSLVQSIGWNVPTMIVGTLVLMSGSYLSWLRVSQRLHTNSQVLVGTALGSTCGITWYWLWHSFVQTAFFSSVYVQILVVLGSGVFCVGFLIYVIKHWIMNGQ